MKRSARRRPDQRLAPASEAENALPLSQAVFHIVLVVADGHAHGYAIMQELSA